MPSSGQNGLDRLVSRSFFRPAVISISFSPRGSVRREGDGRVGDMPPIEQHFGVQRR
jgi:hypothetical protein